jgi:hypothetical protein
MRFRPGSHTTSSVSSLTAGTGAEKVFVARFRNCNPLWEGVLLTPIDIKAVFVAGLIVTPQFSHCPPEKVERPVAPLVKVLFSIEPEMR